MKLVKSDEASARIAADYATLMKEGQVLASSVDSTIWRREIRRRARRAAIPVRTGMDTRGRPWAVRMDLPPLSDEEALAAVRKAFARDRYRRKHGAGT